MAPALATVQRFLEEPVNRALLLSVILMLPGACTAPGGPDGDKDDVLPSESTEVVVVGAGMAGLSAARALAANGKKVVVVEARDRVGGRIDTRSVGSAEIDVGAGVVIKAGAENPVAVALSAFGLEGTPDDSLNIAAWDEVRGWLEKREAGAVLLGAVNFYRTLDDLRAELGTSASVADGVERWLENVPGDDADYRRMASFFAHWYAESSYSGAAADLSLEWAFRTTPYSGTDAVPNGGHEALMDAMAAGLDIRLSQPVTGIEHGDGGVTITTADGVFEADDVVVTVPLGVLKSGSITFDPPLDGERAAAIGRLKMGQYEKVVLTFQADFWTATGGAKMYHATTRPNAFQYVFDASAFTGTPTLVFSAAAAQGGRVSSLGDEAVTNAMNALGEMFPDFPLPQPTASYVTNWKEDPWALGGAAYIPVGASSADLTAAGGSTGTHVYFAGEHTVPDHYGTTHGAMISGLREASAILGTPVTAVPTTLP